MISAASASGAGMPDILEAQWRADKVITLWAGAAAGDPYAPQRVRLAGRPGLPGRR